jgi:threonine aldolase
MAEIRIDLYSDTQTRPSMEMRLAMAHAVVGDEQRGEDPTVNRLTALVRELLGKEDAVFLPSGTMCNEIAILVHCRRGDAIYADRTAHIMTSEGGGPAVFGGALIRPLDGVAGVFSPNQLADQMIEPTRYTPRPRLLSIEQTANLGGGTIWPLPYIEEAAEIARTHGMAVHMDGARLLNAVVASDVTARDYAAPVDSVWIDLSKGLGCPVGAVLAGSKPFIEKAWEWKQRMGGAMRQAGIVAAAGVYALENNVNRLAEDNDKAKVFASRIADIAGIEVDVEGVETNIVLFGTEKTGLSTAAVHQRMADRGVRLSRINTRCLRAVTHLDVSLAQVEEAAEILGQVIGNRGPQ